MRNNGFTLLETIIYCALFSVLMTSALVTVYALVSSSDKTKKATALVAEVNFLEQKFDWIFMGVTAVSVVGSTTVEIVRPDLGSDSPLQLVAKNNTLYLKRASSNEKPLTLSPFFVQHVQFTVSSSTINIRYSINNQEFNYLTKL